MILFWILRAVYEELGECDFKFESTFFFVLERSMMGHRLGIIKLCASELIYEK